MAKKLLTLSFLFIVVLLFATSSRGVRAQDANLIDGIGGKVIEDGDIIIGDRGDYFWMYENGSGELIGRFHTGYEKWDEMAACDVNDDGRAEIIQGDRSTDKIYIYNMYGNELGKHDVNFAAGDDLACGDLTGNGKAEIIHADRNNWIHIFDENFNMVNQFKVPDFADGDAIGAGDLNGDGIDEIIHADASEDTISVYDVNGNLIASLSTTDYFPIDSRDEMAIGDVNLDGIDDVVIAHSSIGSGGVYILDVVKSGTEYDLIKIGYFSIQFSKGDRIAVGDVNTDGVDEIVWASQDGRVKVYNMEGTLLNGPNGLQTEFTYGAGLAVGDVDGDSIVVGPPKQGTLNVVNEVIAVINSPPVDYDVINDTGVFYSEYTDEKTHTTSGSVQATHDVKVTIGLGFKTGMPGLYSTELNLKTSMGYKLQRERGQSYTESITQEMRADMADGMLTVSTDYDVYEFPIISPPELAVVNGEQQYILVTIPKGPPHVHFTHYDSNLHEIGDINTYPTSAMELEGYDPGSYLGTFTMEVGQVGNTYKLNMKDLRWTEEKNTFSIGVCLSAKATTGSKVATGFSGSIEGDYGYQRVTTHKVSFSEETTVLTEYSGRIDDRDKWYNATGVIYRDRDDGHLVLDFFVPSRGEYYEQRNQSPIFINLGMFRINFDMLRLLNKPPECSIAAAPGSGKMPLDVNFTLNLSDPENGSLRWMIDFGDGFTAEGNSSQVSHTYREEGVYPVTLTVYDPWNANATCTVKINVQHNEEPKALFSYSPSEIKAGDEVSFMDSSSDPDGSVAKWSWNFGDGSFSDEKDPKHVYSTQGTYTVMLTVKDESGLKGSYYKEIKVEPKNYLPTADFTFLPKEPKAGEEVSFADKSYDKDGSIVSCIWDFGDGSASSDAEPVHTFSKGGNYTVTLTVRDDKGGEDVKRVTITVAEVEATTTTQTQSETSTTSSTPSSTSTQTKTTTASTSQTPSKTTTTQATAPQSSSTGGKGGICGPGILLLLVLVSLLKRH